MIASIQRWFTPPVFAEDDGKTHRATLSFGVASYPCHGDQAEEVTIKADQALYYSKRTGRDRVTLWTKEVVGG